MLKYREKHPVNLLLLGLFTLCESLTIAVCSSTFLGIHAKCALHFSTPQNVSIFLSPKKKVSVFFFGGGGEL